MKILHLATSFFPRTVGGKEVFIQNIIKSNPEFDHLVVVHDGSETRRYQYDNIPVLVLPMPVTTSKRSSYFSLTYDSIPGFPETLREFRPDVVHFHDFCSGASLTHLRICKELGYKTLLTYHSPGNSCLQKGLMLNGDSPCDGRIDMLRCTTCRYSIKGMPSVISSILGRIEVPFDKGGKYFFRNNTRLFFNSWKEFMSSVDVIQLHAQWLVELMVTNGVDRSKIHFVDLGGVAQNRPVTPHHISGPLKIVFSGRTAPVKGIHLLIDAVNGMPDEHDFEVHVFTPATDGESYGQMVLQRLENNSHFKVPRSIPPDRIIDELTAMDVCVIPSLWPETGPFTVFDSFAAGLPVIGTNHAGIRERVRDGVDGLLFEWGSADDLRRKILRVVEDRPFLEKLRANIRPQRTVTDFSLDLRRLYEHIAATRSLPTLSHPV